MWSDFLIVFRIFCQQGFAPRGVFLQTGFIRCAADSARPAGHTLQKWRSPEL